MFEKEAKERAKDYTDLHIDKPVYAIHLANVHEGVN